MMKRWGFGAASVLVALAVGCKSKSDGGGGSGDGDGDGDGDLGGAGGESGGGDGDGDGDGDGSASVRPESGERLKLRMWSGGGIDWVESVYDAELGAPCQVLTATDDSLRCFPVNDAATAGVQVVFTDEDCTQPIGRTWDNGCSEVGRYASMDVPGDCYPRQSVSYEVGDEVDLPATVYELDSRGNCLGVDAEGVGHELVEVPLEDLATVTTEVVPRALGLGTRLFVSEDGLRFPVSAYDLEADFPCYYQTLGARDSGLAVCVGNLAYTDSSGHYGYSDDACGELAVGSTQCAEPAYIMAYSQVDECWETQLFGVGPKLDEVYSSAEEMCSPTEESFYHAFYGVGEALDEDLLPALELSHVGDTRLVREGYAHEGVTFYESNSIWDTLLEEYCYPREIDGRTYCLPNSTLEMGPEGTWYGDPDCTEPLQYYVNSACYHVSYTMIGKWSEQKVCESTPLDALHAAEVYEGDIVYVIGPEGECVEEPAVEDATYIKAGDPIDPSELLVEVSLDQN